MKKALLSFAMALVALGANAQGMVTVGANIEILPATKYAAEENRSWKAMAWICNTGIDYSSDPAGYDEATNPHHNVVYGTPSQDGMSVEWYMPEYVCEDVFDSNAFTGEEIVWQECAAPFSSNGDTYNGVPVGTQWTTNNIIADIYLRRTFTWNTPLPCDVYLACGHDDAPCEYYLNGVLIHSIENGWNESDFYKLTEEQKSLIKTDGTENLLAIHVHQNYGGAYADCGLYTLVEGGLETGSVTPWEGTTLFNSCGAYNFDGVIGGAPDPLAEWSALYEAGADDVYTIQYAAPTTQEAGNALVQFKTPINLAADGVYTFKATISVTEELYEAYLNFHELDDPTVKAVAEAEYLDAVPGEPLNVEVELTGANIKNLNIAFDFVDFGEDNGTPAVEIKNMSLTDADGKELWIGTHYFTYMHNSDGTKRIKLPTFTGRVETGNWLLPEYDDSNWDTFTGPIGDGGVPKCQTPWGAGVNNNKERNGNTTENTNRWIRRTFEIEKINPELSYALNVYHDDDYWCYINGHLLQQFTGWTKGEPKQVHIPAKYLRVGKNVIATYIRQNWGGSGFDCGINVEVVDFQAEINNLRSVMELANAEANLTTGMRDSLATLLVEAEYEIANNKDAAEVKEFAKNLKTRIETVFGWEGSVNVVQQLIPLCEKEGVAEKLAEAKAYDACKTGPEVNKLVDALRIARKRNAAERHNIAFVGAQPEAGKKFYIFNVGEKQFLGGGQDHGTHAVVDFYSNPMMLVDEVRNIDNEGNQLNDVAAKIEGGFRIQTGRLNGATRDYQYLDWNGFVDCAGNEHWQFIPVEGKTNVFNIARLATATNNDVAFEDGSLKLLGYRNGTENGNGYSYNWVDTDCKTPSLASNQWMLIPEEELVATLDKATADAPVDASFLFSNPGFYSHMPEVWFDGAVDGNHGRAGSWQPGDYVFEGWNNTSFEWTAEEYNENIPAGFFQISVQAFYRDGGDANELVANDAAGTEPMTNAELWAGDESVAIVNIREGSNMSPGLGQLSDDKTMRIPGSVDSSSADYFQNGFYKNYLTFENTEEGYMTFGISKFEGVERDWIVFDNFRLKYFGATAPDPTGITEVEKNTNAPKAIFNLQGQKLNKAAKGVNIINGKKVVIK